MLLLVWSPTLVARGSGAVAQRPAICSRPHMSASETPEPTLPKTGGYVQFCAEDVMAPKGHGTSEQPVQKDLRWNVDRRTADRICNFNRDAAEYPGFWKAETRYFEEVERDVPTVYYDSVTGKPLFVAPIGRTMDEFLAESERHGWPSFRDAEVVWENVRVLKASGEAVSVTGSHLGHNLPDARGNRYCVNIVSVAGRPADSAAVKVEDEGGRGVGSDRSGASSSRFPGFAAWIAFVWAGIPALLAVLDIQIPERL